MRASRTFFHELDTDVLEWKEKLRESARFYAPNDHIRKKIVVTHKREGEGYRFTVSADTPDAHAFEFGSGLWATDGPRGTYIIKSNKISPKTKKPLLLSFFWENKVVDFVGPFVRHPGVEGVGYLAGAVADVLELMDEELGRVIERTISKDWEEDSREVDSDPNVEVNFHPPVDFDVRWDVGTPSVRGGLMRAATAKRDPRGRFLPK